MLFISEVSQHDFPYLIIPLSDMALPASLLETQLLKNLYKQQVQAEDIQTKCTTHYDSSFERCLNISTLMSA